MKTVGIICEYNPFHNGHKKQLQWIRDAFGQDCAIVCLMSGSYVQRGAPAIVDKSLRARAALLGGADLILELPATVCLSSAEGFAAGGVKILSRCCDALCFGVESMEEEALYQTAQALLSPAFSILLKEQLSTGCSFPAARQAALGRLGLDQSLTLPNDILAVEYVKAILNQNSPMGILPIRRGGNYHSDALDPVAPSATAVRKALLSGENWETAVPESSLPLLQNASLHTLEAGERAILFKLRTMTEAEFEALPYGSEGLWRKLMKAARSQTSLAHIVQATKSKRYTRTRIDRMLLCAFLGFTQADMGVLPAKIRVLGFTDRGRRVLRGHDCFRNAGAEIDETEARLEGLYGLFRTDSIDPPDAEQKRRIIYLSEET